MAPRSKSVLPKTRSPEEWEAFFRCMATRYPTGARNHALLYLTYLAGLRIGETLALRLQDVDLDRLKVHVTRRQPDRAVTVRRATPRESPRAPARE
jgi:site-specific recombinase XerD